MRSDSKEKLTEANDRIGQAAGLAKLVAQVCAGSATGDGEIEGATAILARDLIASANALYDIVSAGETKEVAPTIAPVVVKKKAVRS